jgi:hypothetical protein
MPDNDNQQYPIDRESWLRDRAAAAELLAADMLNDEPRRVMSALAEIYRRWSERTRSRSAQSSSDTT